MNKMVTRIFTSDLRKKDFNPHDALSVYNGLDVLNTFDLHQALAPLLDADTRKIYTFSRAVQAPVIDMMLFGIKVDQVQRKKMLAALFTKRDRYTAIINKFTTILWGRPLNVESPYQMMAFFYTTLRVPPVKVRKGNEYKISTNAEALETMWQYLHIRPIITFIQALRDVITEIEVCSRSIGADGRMRCSFNIAGTVSGRWSSSKDISGQGANLQNVASHLRTMFISDPGMKLAYIDLEQAESRAVGYVVQMYCGDSSYLRACEAGDLHTLVCKMIWPELPWVGDNKGDKQVAETPYVGHYSYRDMAKRGGHLSNYGGSPSVMAIALKVTKAITEEFQQKYFAAFPGIKEWHHWVAAELRNSGCLTTPFGRRRRFFGRLDDHKTLNGAISYTPQSLIGDQLNTGLLNFWRACQNGLPAQLLIQVHDAIVIQYVEGCEREVIEKAVACLEAPLEGTTFSIPSDAQVGWNWAKKSPLNLDGLSKFIPSGDGRVRSCF